MPVSALCLPHGEPLAAASRTVTRESPKSGHVPAAIQYSTIMSLLGSSMKKFRKS